MIKQGTPPRTLKQKQESNGRTLALDGATWRKLRATVLAGEPLCRYCNAQGLIVPATEVDHRNGPADNRLESLQPLCKPCHSRQTSKDMGKSVSMGCDVDGLPLDPAHPWSKATTGRLSSPDGIEGKRSRESKFYKPLDDLFFNANCEGTP